MDPRLIAAPLIAGRFGFGIFLALFPDRAATLVVRRKRRQGDAARLLRAVGIRDLVLASGLLAALNGRGSTRAWALAGVASDAADLAGTAALRDDLEPKAFTGTVAAASGGIALGVLASRPQS